MSRTAHSKPRTMIYYSLKTCRSQKGRLGITQPSYPNSCPGLSWAISPRKNDASGLKCFMPELTIYPSVLVMATHTHTAFSFHSVHTASGAGPAFLHQQHTRPKFICSWNHRGLPKLLYSPSGGVAHCQWWAGEEVYLFPEYWYLLEPLNSVGRLQKCPISKDLSPRSFSGNLRCYKNYPCFCPTSPSALPVCYRNKLSSSRRCNFLCSNTSTCFACVELHRKLVLLSTNTKVMGSNYERFLPLNVLIDCQQCDSSLISLKFCTGMFENVNP